MLYTAPLVFYYMLFTSYDKDSLILIFHNIYTSQLQHAFGRIMMMANNRIGVV